MAALQEVTEQTFEQEVLLTDLPVLVEFGAAWCGPCKTVAPELEALARELEGKAKVVTVDVDRSQMIAQQLGVRSVPTFVVFSQGRPVNAKAGALRKAELRQLVEPYFPRAAGALKPLEVVELLKRRQIVLVDTREAIVWKRVHLPGAVNLPAEEILGRLAELHMLPATPVLYCRTGEKTKALAEQLAAEGLPISFLEGGVLEWEANGLPIERP